MDASHDYCTKTLVWKSYVKCNFLKLARTKFVQTWSWSWFVWTMKLRESIGVLNRFRTKTLWRFFPTVILLFEYNKIFSVIYVRSLAKAIMLVGNFSTSACTSSNAINVVLILRRILYHFKQRQATLQPLAVQWTLFADRRPLLRWCDRQGRRPQMWLPSLDHGVWQYLPRLLIRMHAL